MLANVVFIGCEKKSFEKDGKLIDFQRVTFIEDGEEVPVTVGSLSDLDFSALPRFSPIKVQLQLQNNRNGQAAVKIIQFQAK
jgi:hypothetical protein